MESNINRNSPLPNCQYHPYLIGIAGGSGGGKTSVAKKIYECLGKNNCLLFSMDTYYKDLTEEQRAKISEYNFDEPDALDLNLLSSHLQDLMNWKEIDMPTYDFTDSKRLKETIRIKPNKCIIFEGILAFYDKRIRDLMNLKIFVDMDADIRLSRRIYRDIVERGRNLITIIERYHEFVKPAHNKFISPTKKYADFLIPRGAENTISTDLICSFVKIEIEKAFPNTQIQEEAETNKNKKNNKFLFNKELIDFKMPENININTDLLIFPSKENKENLLKLLSYFFNEEKKNFYQVVIEAICESLFNLIPKDLLKNFIVIYQSNLLEQVKMKLMDESTINTIIIFTPILTEESQTVKELIEASDSSNVKSIILLSVIFNEELTEWINKINSKIYKIIAIYSGVVFERYNELYLKNSGYKNSNLFKDLVGFQKHFENAMNLEFNKKSFK